MSVVIDGGLRAAGEPQARVQLPLCSDYHLIAANCCKEIGHCRVHMVEAELLDGGTMSFLQIEREFNKVLQTAVSWH